MKFVGILLLGIILGVGGAFVYMVMAMTVCTGQDRCQTPPGIMADGSSKPLDGGVHDAKPAAKPDLKPIDTKAAEEEALLRQFHMRAPLLTKPGLPRVFPIYAGGPDRVFTKMLIDRVLEYDQRRLALRHCADTSAPGCELTHLTFALLGQFVLYNPETAKAIVEHGHTIIVEGWDKNQSLEVLAKKPEIVTLAQKPEILAEAEKLKIPAVELVAVRQDFERTRDLIFRVTGYQPTAYLRPTGQGLSKAQQKYLWDHKVLLIGWSGVAGDTRMVEYTDENGVKVKRQTNADEILRAVERETPYDGHFVLFTISGKDRLPTVEATLKMFERYRTAPQPHRVLPLCTALPSIVCPIQPAITIPPIASPSPAPPPPAALPDTGSPPDLAPRAPHPVEIPATEEGDDGSPEDTTPGAPT